MIADKFIETFEVDDWEVETDTGWEDITHTNKTIEFEVWELSTDNYTLQCADDHIVMDEFYNEVFTKDLKIGQRIITKTGLESVKSVRNLGYKESMYDLSVGSENHTYYTSGILSHNTTVSSVYLTHYAIFNEHKTVAVLANKEKTAIEIMNRIKMVYENLPYWLQPGIVEGGWNKASITLGNGTRILSASTASSAIRGYSINCLTENNKVTIRDKLTKEVSDVTIKELRLLFNDKIRKKFNIFLNTKYDVLTPNGFQNFYGLSEQKVRNNNILKITTDNSFLELTRRHEVFFNDNEKQFGHFYKVGDSIKSKDGFETVTATENLSISPYVYDLLNVANGNRFYANGLLVSNCLFLDEFAFVASNIASEFMDSVWPTISSGKTTKIIIVSTPNGMNHYYNIWIDAVKGKNTFFPVKVNWWEHPDRDENFKKNLIRDRGVVFFNQEYACSEKTSRININKNGEKKTLTFGELWNWNN